MNDQFNQINSSKKIQHTIKLQQTIKLEIINVIHFIVNIVVNLYLGYLKSEKNTLKSEKNAADKES